MAVLAYLNGHLMVLRFVPAEALWNWGQIDWGKSFPLL